MPANHTSKTARPRRAAAKRRSVQWRIVLIDQVPLRKAAIADCQRLMKQVDSLRGKLQHFEQVDQPAYERWMARTFGAILTELRRLHDEIRDLESLIEAVEWNVRTRGESRRAAYARVQRARSGEVDAPEEEEEPDPNVSRAESRDVDDWEEELLFEEMLEDVMGVNPAHMDDETYERMFQQFKDAMHGRVPDPEEEGNDEETENLPSAPSSPVNTTSRLKQLYRQLVRRLHPDARSGSDATASALWHEVQDAYERGDVERLETLMAYTDVQENVVGEHTLLSQLLQIVSELKQTVTALRRAIRQSQGSNAWNFGGKLLAPLEEKLAESMNDELSWLQSRKAHLEEVVASWQASRREARG